MRAADPLPRNVHNLARNHVVPGSPVQKPSSQFGGATLSLPTCPRGGSCVGVASSPGKSGRGTRRPRR